MSIAATASAEGRAAFDRLLAELRPKLHRYCARMTGSVIDGEDVLQDAYLKAIEAFPKEASVDNPEGWLFRIVHNASLDFLRRRARQAAARSEEDPDMTADSFSPVHDREIVAASLHMFMRLPAAQRSSVILMDVLGYSLDEINRITDASIPAIKAALHRGRTRLRELAAEPDERPQPTLAEPERKLLAGYVDRFNARDFDAIRNMLADEVRLELVNWTQLAGPKEVSRYFGNYDKVSDWHLVPGFVDRRPALLVRDPADPSAPPRYFVLLRWAGDSVLQIRDFRHAPYAIDGAELAYFD
jgi:RNA polymerase sigma-70 factor, ECF subfamily